jgi:hypothetical protein
VTGDRVRPEAASVLLAVAAEHNAERLWAPLAGALTTRVRRQLDIATSETEMAIARDSGLGWAGPEFPDDRMINAANRILRERQVRGVSRGNAIALSFPWVRGKFTLPMYLVAETPEILTATTCGLLVLDLDGEVTGATGSAGVLPTRKQMVTLAGGVHRLNAGDSLIVAPDPLTAVIWRCQAGAEGDYPNLPAIASIPTMKMTADQARQLEMLAQGAPIVLGTAASPSDPDGWAGEERIRQFRRMLKGTATDTNVELVQIPAPEAAA